MWSLKSTLIIEYREICGMTHLRNCVVLSYSSYSAKYFYTQIRPFSNPFKIDGQLSSLSILDKPPY